MSELLQVTESLQNKTSKATRMAAFHNNSAAHLKCCYTCYNTARLAGRTCPTTFWQVISPPNISDAVPEVRTTNTDVLQWKQHPFFDNTHHATDVPPTTQIEKDGDNNCPICSNPMPGIPGMLKVEPTEENHNSTLRLAGSLIKHDNCNHIFHKACFNTWIITQVDGAMLGTCPIDRGTVYTPTHEQRELGMGYWADTTTLTSYGQAFFRKQRYHRYHASDGAQTFAAGVRYVYLGQWSQSRRRREGHRPENQDYVKRKTRLDCSAYLSEGDVASTTIHYSDGKNSHRVAAELPLHFIG